MKWNSEPLIGNDLMDDEHKEIIQLINGLLESRDGSIEQGRNIDQLLSDLVIKITQHFVNEERLMEQGGCPEAKLIEHANTHTQILSPLVETRFEPNGKIIKQTIPRLKEEITQHIATIDIECAPYITD